MVEPQDEEIHPVGAGEHWQESWYFNWCDPRQRVFGLSRIGFRFRERRVDAVVLSLRDGRPEYLYPGVGLRLRGAWTAQTAAGGLRAGHLVHRAEVPLRRWRVTLTGRQQMDLAFEAFTPPFDYRESGGIPAGLATGHLEQSGRVTGWTDFRGRRTAIDGFGQRDRSWGPRDWANVAGWDWISAQFGDALSVSAWAGHGDGDRSAGGFVFGDGENHAIETLEVEYAWAGRHLPRAAAIDVRDRRGRRYLLRASAIGRFPLWRRGLWIEEVHASFRCERPGLAAVEGLGVIEHAWRAGVGGSLRGAGALLRSGAAAVRW